MINKRENQKTSQKTTPKKQENGKPLKNDDVEWLRIQRTLIEKRKLTDQQKASIRTKYWRFKKKFLRTLEILTETAKLLPERQREQVLNAETVKPLIDALLAYEPEKKSKAVVNKRAFLIAYQLASCGESVGYALLKNPYNILLKDYACKRMAMRLIWELSDITLKS